MNGELDERQRRAQSDVNVALAMAVDNAVCRGGDPQCRRTSLGDIAKRRNDSARVRRANKTAALGDISGATFTISNLGMFDVDAFTAIIVPPQAGILAVGAISDRVVAVSGDADIRPTIAVRPIVTLTLSSDHRVIDGAGAAAFLADVAGELQAS